MEANMTFRGMESSQAMEQYAAKYLTKFKKYFGKEEPDSIFVSVIFEGKLNHHIYSCEVRIKAPHFDLVAKREGAEMYPLIDETMKVMEKELQNKKQRIVDDLRKKKKLV
ncbi:MAG: ribosome-associated translation inhibitor RaiA [Candidatus Dependentiae bacterium]|nr:ribosome-associated translation inhibitor RaiA [Candidatus Dependentiae bacterium]